MSHDFSPLSISFAGSMAEIDQEQWNSLAEDESPFLRWEWLNLLETSGCVCQTTGWQPAHLTVHQGGRLVGAAALYLKAHGSGEFVFDGIWADVAARLGLIYYPKLVLASPFTPVQGYRFLIEKGLGRARTSALMLGAIEKLREANHLSGCAGLFLDETIWDDFKKAGYLAWVHQGFIWSNHNYGDFEDFLGTLRANRRKNIHRERRLLAKSGLGIEAVPGPDAPLEWFYLMHRYYLSTSDKFGEYGCRYLNLEFFLGLAEVFRPYLLFVAAFKPGRAQPVGLSMLVKDDKALYGRYWGADQDVAYLHFELCYYTPLSLAIKHGLRTYDPGMGGEHKPCRGFDSRVTMSLHHFADVRLEAIFAHYIQDINQLEIASIEELNNLVPYNSLNRP